MVTQRLEGGQTVPLKGVRAIPRSAGHRLVTQAQGGPVPSGRTRSLNSDIPSSQS